MKRRFRSLRRKRVVRWFTNREVWPERGSVAFTVTNTAGAIEAAILAIHQRDSPATADLVEREARHTFDTIRGDLAIEANPDTAMILHAGILVCDLDGFGAPLKKDPGDPKEAGEAWLWLGHRFVPPYNSPNGPAWVPGWDIHVQSKRVMKDNQALVLLMSADAAMNSQGDAGFVWVWPHLRTLVSHGE